MRPGRHRCRPVPVSPRGSWGDSQSYLSGKQSGHRDGGGSWCRPQPGTQLPPRMTHKGPKGPCALASCHLLSPYQAATFAFCPLQRGGGGKSQHTSAASRRAVGGGDNQLQALGAFQGQPQGTEDGGPQLEGDGHGLGAELGACSPLPHLRPHPPTCSWPPGSSCRQP